MENNYLNQKKHRLHTLFGRNAYLHFKDEEDQDPKATIDLDDFKRIVCEEIEHLNFSDVKHEEAQQIDHIRLYTELSWPTEPDIAIRLFLFQNPDATFFLEAIR